MARRSVLFSPGNRPSLLRKAPDSGADTIVFDLEDGVAPTEKPAAREAIAEILADPSFDPAAEVCVRVNPTGVAADDDLDTVLDGGVPDSVMVPKVAAADDIETIHRLLAEHGVSVPVFALIETAAGVLAAPSIAAADPTTALVFGGEDLTADIGATRTADGTELQYARQRVVIAASAGGVDAIDTVFTDLEDTDGLRAEARFAATLGFDGKLAVHPDQVEPITAAFTPDSETVAWAKRVLEARDTHEGEGVFRVDDEMIDAPLITRAEQILDRANADAPD
ncbi:MAG: CoA ester lyase [Halobacteriaceae archaeon]